VTNHGAVVPSLWRLEVANSLTGAMRRGRIDMDFRRDALTYLGFLDISVDTFTQSHAWGVSVELADRFRLTLYDAAYVELALRRRLPLATLDKEMRSATRALPCGSMPPNMGDEGEKLEMKSFILSRFLQVSARSS
jgi:predicted nucleic acid-binding protein